MKSLKLAVIAVIVAITMVGTANAGTVPSSNKNPGKIINITLQQALSNPGLIVAISQQVTLDEVLRSPAVIYTAKVSYRGYTFQISGLHDQWILFFKMINQVPSGVSSNTFGVK
jgi:hypothetical protein